MALVQTSWSEDAQREQDQLFLAKSQRGIVRGEFFKRSTSILIAVAGFALD
jgi:hypothetical protein